MIHIRGKGWYNLDSSRNELLCVCTVYINPFTVSVTFWFGCLYMQRTVCTEWRETWHTSEVEALITRASV